MQHLYIFTTPPDTTCVLRHDDGPTFTAVPDTSIRPDGHRFDLDGIGDGHGCWLDVTHPSKQPEHLRGILWFHGPLGVMFQVDDIHLPNGAAPVTASLTTRGQFFQLETGEYFTAIEASEFNLLNRWQRGEDIDPILAQRAACGFNLLRVWTLFAIGGIGSMLSCSYEMIPEFVARCASFGLHVEFTAYTGINVPDHWFYLGLAARRCTVTPLLSLLNELDANTNEPDVQGRYFDAQARLCMPGHAPQEFEPIAGVLCSHGSNGSQAQPVQPFWDYTEMHFNDAPEWTRKVGHNSMEVWGGPTLANENTRAIDHFNNLTWAFDAAAGAGLLCAGSCFHSQRGKTSELWDGDELACAQAWADGAKSVERRFQDGQYRHATELETPGILRAYQRVLASGEAGTVVIHV